MPIHNAFGISVADSFVLVLLGISALTVLIGCVLFLSNPRRDMPARDSSARIGFNLVIFSSLLAFCAVVLSLALRWWS